jgi:hypothetical protein
MIPRKLLSGFVRESNRIEGINRPPTADELDATLRFVGLGTLTRDDVTGLVGVFQPDAVLRDQPGLNVRVGPHRPPAGGPDISTALDEIIGIAHTATHPYVTHHAYETLHPYTDGNGRSGRALWLWGMRRRDKFGRSFDLVLELGFLHTWYYQSLEFARDDAG